MGTAAASARLLPATHIRRTHPTIARPTLPIRGTIRRVGHERFAAVVVAAIVLGASVLSITPGQPGQPGDTGGPIGDGPGPRLAVGGAVQNADGFGSVEEAYDPAYAFGAVTRESPAPSAPVVNALSRIVGVDTADPEAQSILAERATRGSPVEGPFLADGTLLKPVAVDTTVADGSDLVRTYKVKAGGETLVKIAKAHGVSMMSLWWANKLKTKELKKGQVLTIPPVSGLIIEVKAGQTLEGLAAKHKVDGAAILEANGITDPNLVVGQVLVLPGAKGAPMPTPKPTKKPTPTTTRSSSGSVRAPSSYSGGNFGWPTSSRSISQYYRYGHYGLDIDGSTGDPVYAAASGTVTFAGWKSNGGGYQVWIAHGSGLYTTYNHMSSVSVGRGQQVGKRQQVGRVGASGFASGSHLHFEVWKGPIWNGGRRVNPLAYL
ncbi:hypothetical protein BH20CHL7_BH20CHL7_09030 [soil metagenome]